jgi:hypothetical protein
VLLHRVDSAGNNGKAMSTKLVKGADRPVGSKIPAARHGTRMATAQQMGQLFPASPGACAGSLASRTRAIARDLQALMVEVLEGAGGVAVRSSAAVIPSVAQGFDSALHG